VTSVAEVSQAAAFASITGPQGSVGEMAAASAPRRDLMVDILELAGMLRSRPIGAFYALVDFCATRLTGLPLAEAVSFAGSDDLVAQDRRRLVDFSVAYTADGAS
jgi:hypothetical protein